MKIYKILSIIVPIFFLASCGALFVNPNKKKSEFPFLSFLLPSYLIGYSSPLNATPQDKSPLEVTSTIPTNNSFNIEPTQSISIFFNKKVNTSTPWDSYIIVTDSASQIVSGQVVSKDQEIIFIPQTPLSSNMIYTIKIKTGISDESGNLLLNDFIFSFTTKEILVDQIGLSVTSTNPTNDSIGILSTQPVQLDFNASIDSNTVSNSTVFVTQNGGIVSGTYTTSGSTITFTPSSNWLKETLYSVSISMGLKDTLGRRMASAYNFQFYTEQDTSFRVTSTNPVNNAKQISVSQSINVTFSDSLNSTSISNTTFQVTDSAGNAVAGTYSINSNIAIFQPVSNLQPLSKYYVALTTGIQNSSLTSLSEVYNLSFMTALTPTVSAGTYHTCMTTSGGQSKCWGEGSLGSLGYGNSNSIYSASSASYYNLGSDSLIVKTTTGTHNSCAILDNGLLKCLGDSSKGQLGYGDYNSIMDFNNLLPVPIPIIKNISSGWYHTCVLLTDSNIRCWGYGHYSQIGIVSERKNYSPYNVSWFPSNPIITDISAGGYHTCIVTSIHSVRCFGKIDEGQMGVNTNGLSSIYDEISGSFYRAMGSYDTSDINLGTGLLAKQVSAGGYHTCVLLTTGEVKCWGLGTQGQLGYGTNMNITIASNAGILNFGGYNVSQISAGGYHTCVILQNGNVRCFGDGSKGQLGYGNNDSINDSSVSTDISFGERATYISAGTYHTCVVLQSEKVKCWGLGSSGQLGYGNTNSINSATSAQDILP